MRDAGCGMRGAGCGVREGIGADAPMIFYWEYTQASLKYPYKSKKKLTFPTAPIQKPMKQNSLHPESVFISIEDFYHFGQFSSIFQAVSVQQKINKADDKYAVFRMPGEYILFDDNDFLKGVAYMIEGAGFLHRLFVGIQHKG